MKIMSRDFTTREKIMLLVLTLILLAAGYYAGIDQPIRTAINEAKSQQDELNTELMLLQTKAASLSRMQSELDSIEQSGSLGKMGSYNNSKAELDELNQLLQDAAILKDGTPAHQRFQLLRRLVVHGESALLQVIPCAQARCEFIRFLCAGNIILRNIRVWAILPKPLCKHFVGN